MGGLSIWHWLIFLVVALLLFGGSGKISSIMGDVAKGIKSFKKGMSEDDVATTPAADPFKKEEPKALNTAGATQTAPDAQGGAAPTSTAQVNKVS
jgi:sec-independent protein translocase protein TatA